MSSILLTYEGKSLFWVVEKMLRTVSFIWFFRGIEETINCFRDLFTEATVKLRVLTLLLYRCIQAFSNCLWKGFLIVMYCDLFTKKWYLINKHALELATIWYLSDRIITAEVLLTSKIQEIDEYWINITHKVQILESLQRSGTSNWSQTLNIAKSKSFFQVTQKVSKVGYF